MSTCVCLCNAPNNHSELKLPVYINCQSRDSLGHAPAIDVTPLGYGQTTQNKYTRKDKQTLKGCLTLRAGRTAALGVEERTHKDGGRGPPEVGVRLPDAEPHDGRGGDVRHGEHGADALPDGVKL